MQGVEGDRTPRRYFYISFLRDPVARYLSEFRSACTFLPAIIYVGAGNYLTITGANFTAEELGTASSATKGVIGPNG